MFKKQAFYFIFFLLLIGNISADWDDRFGPAKITYLSEILENPEAWMNVEVRIPLRFLGMRSVYNPFFTQFNRETDLNFAAWDIQTPLWEKEGFSQDYPHFYVEKYNVELKTFLKLQTFETIAVLGKVIGSFRQKPYIRVVWVCRLPGKLNVHNLKFLNNAFTAFQEQKFDRALDYFKRVLVTSPPNDIRVVIYKTRAQIYLYHRKNYVKALTELKKGLSISKRDADLNEMYTQCKYYLIYKGDPPQPVATSNKSTGDEESETKAMELPSKSTTTDTSKEDNVSQ